MNKTFSIVGLVLIGCMLANGSAAQQNDAVEAYKADLAAVCSESDLGRLVTGEGFETRRDLTGDGLPDVVISQLSASCERAASAFCGSGGCDVAVFVAEGNDYRLAFETLTRSFEVSGSGANAVLQFGLHGSACGLSGAEDCRKSFVWNGSRFVEN